MKITIPWAALASSNQRNRRRGGKAHSRQYKTSREAIYMVACGQVKGDRPAFPEGHVSVSLRFYPPDYRRRDCANYLKVVADALQTVVYADDHQIRSMSWLRAEVDEDNPRVEVTIQEAA